MWPTLFREVDVICHWPYPHGCSTKHSEWHERQINFQMKEHLMFCSKYMKMTIALKAGGEA